MGHVVLINHFWLMRPCDRTSVAATGDLCVLLIGLMKNTVFEVGAFTAPRLLFRLMFGPVIHFL